MINDDRIVTDVIIAIDRLEAIKTVYERDGFISRDYLEEKAYDARCCVEFLMSLVEAI